MIKKPKVFKGWQRVLLLIIPYIIFLGLFQYAGGLIVGIDYTNEGFQKTSFQKLIVYFSGLLGTFLILWIFMKFIDKDKFVNLGFKIKHKLNEFNIGVVVGLIVMLAGFSLIYAIGEINLEQFLFDPKEFVLTLLLFAVVAVVEETLIRGYVLRNLMKSFSKYSSLILSSIIFSLFHGLNPNIDLLALCNLFLAGILLGLSYMHTKNLWFPIGLHLGWNLFQSLLGFNVSGTNAYSIIEFNLTDQNILNGGYFGFEGSVFCVIAQLILILIIKYHYRTIKPTHAIQAL
jgi:hypothetical protein